MSRAFAKLLDPSQLTHVELEAWSHLAEHASTANVFLDPLFVLPAVRHLPGASRARLLVVAPSPRRWSAVVLVMPGSRWRRLPLPALGTWVHDQQGLATGLTSMTQQVAITVGIPILGSLAATQATSQAGLRLALIIDAAVVVVGAGLVWHGLRPRTLTTDGPSAPARPADPYVHVSTEGLS